MSFIESYDQIRRIRDTILGELDIWRHKENGMLAFGLAIPENYSIDELKKRSVV